MTILIDVLIYIVLIGAAVLVIGTLLYSIHTLLARIRRINARLIWRTVSRHRRRHNGSVL